MFTTIEVGVTVTQGSVDLPPGVPARCHPATCLQIDEAVVVWVNDDRDLHGVDCDRCGTVVHYGDSRADALDAGIEHALAHRLGLTAA